MKTKICKKCGERLRITEFSLSGHKGRKKKWHRNECRKCEMIRQKRRKEQRLGRKINTRIPLTLEEREEKRRVYKKEWRAKRKIRRIENKKKAIEFLGGKCKKCGYAKCFWALEFHHKTGKKEGGISRMIDCDVSWKKIVKELLKCELLCANCHRELHCDK